MKLHQVLTTTCRYHSYHHTFNLWYFKPYSFDPNGIIHSSSDLVVSFSVTFGKVIGVEITLSWMDGSVHQGSKESLF